jgi:CBS domain-containing protein
MQTVAEVMTRNVQAVSPQESLQRAAQLMDELDVGALPVVSEEGLVGMVTDRDITVRGTAAGLAPQASHVDEVMSAHVRWCYEDQPLDEVMIQMADSQLRRIPVVSHDDQKKLIGIVSLGDVAIRTGEDQKEDVQQVVEMVSSPGGVDGAGDQAGVAGLDNVGV